MARRHCLFGFEIRNPGQLVHHNARGSSMNDLFLLLLFLAVNTDCFVFDVKRATVVRGGSNSNESSFFGYSVDLLKSDNRPWLFVGAPKDLGPEGAVEGSLSACRLEENGSGAITCSLRKPKTDLQYGDGEDTFEDQLMGVTVMANEHGQVWSCAPRFQRPKEKMWPNDPRLHHYSMMLGHCFLFDQSDQFSSGHRVVPLNLTRVFFGRQNMSEDYAYGTTYAQLGMSMHTMDNEILFGAPGAWNWTGTVVVTDSQGQNTVMTQPWSDWEPRVNDYAGYAITSGNFVRDSSLRPRRQQLVVGAPRAGGATVQKDIPPKDRAGAIFVVEYEGKPIIKQVQKLKGRQTGEYFGSALACADLNGDGIDEIIVGAPLFTNESLVTSYEEGRVSIQQLDERRNLFIEVLSLFGRSESGRFGHSIASLGDLDGDGMADFAVGAPFEDEGRGAVRIYYGKRDLAHIQEPGQVIRAADVDPNLRGFGVSFSSAVDIDGNGVSDLAIGAHNSGAAVVIRARPVAEVVIRATSSIPFIDSSNVTSRDFELRVCLTAETASVLPSALLNIKSDKRCEFGSGGGGSQELQLKVPLIKGQEKCLDPVQVSLKSSFKPRGRESPLLFTISLANNIADDDKSKFCGSCGVFDPRKEHKQVMILPFQSGCGADEVCTSDLTVAARVPGHQQNPFVIGSSDFLTVIFAVSNIVGEPAFRPELRLQLPERISPRKFESICTTKKIRNGDKSRIDGIRCEIPEPVRAGEHYDIEIEFDVKNLTGGMRVLNFANIEVVNIGKDSDMTNNRVDYALSLSTEADLEILPTSAKGTRIPLEKKNDDDPKFGQQFQQNFQIRKLLSSPVKDIWTQFDVPISLDGLSLVNVTSVVLSGDSNGNSATMQCQVKRDVVRVAAGGHRDDNAINCTTAGVKCVEIKCPPFDLMTPSAVATVQLLLELDTRHIVELFGEKEFSVATEGHVRFNSDLEATIKPELNNKADNAFFTTEFFVSQVTFAGTSTWAIVVAVVVALLVLLCILVLCLWWGCFKRREPPNAAAKAEATQDELLNLQEPMSID